jgi:hypothetical protein
MKDSETFGIEKGHGEEVVYKKFWRVRIIFMERRCESCT